MSKTATIAVKFTPNDFNKLSREISEKLTTLAQMHEAMPFLTLPAFVEDKWIKQINSIPKAKPKDETSKPKDEKSKPKAETTKPKDETNEQKPKPKKFYKGHKSNVKPAEKQVEEKITQFRAEPIPDAKTEQ